jgi:hypothetical protein
MNILFDYGKFDSEWLGDVTGYMTTYNSHWYDTACGGNGKIYVPREVWQVRHENGVE